jgi:hypothetical protein
VEERNIEVRKLNVFGELLLVKQFGVNLGSVLPWVSNHGAIAAIIVLSEMLHILDTCRVECRIIFQVVRADKSGFKKVDQLRASILESLIDARDESIA